MYPYPFFNFVFGFLLILLLVLRFHFYNFESPGTSFGTYILRHPYHQDGFQIIEVGDYKFKTLIYPKYYIGDYINIKFKENNSRSFIYFPQISVFESRSIYVTHFIGRFREFLVDRVKRLPQPYAGLLLGFSIGFKQDYPSNIRDILISTGTIHLVVFSGSNVSIITDKFCPFLYKLGKLFYFFGTFLVLIFIVLVVGFEAPVIRAIIMAFIQNIAKIFGLNGSIIVSIFYTAFLMLLFYPPYLFDLSFQLSFSSTLVAVIISDFLSLMEKSLAKEILSGMLMVIFLYPLISFYFGVFSLKSLFVNVLVSFVVPFIVLGGFLFIVLPNAILKVVLLILIDYFIVLADFFNRFNFLNVPVRLDLNTLVYFYASALFVFFFWKLRLKRLFIKYA